MTIIAGGILYAKGESMKLFLLMLILSVKVYAETQVFNSIARVDGKIAYLETHTVVYKGNLPTKSLTEFWDPNGKRIGVMRSDFIPNLAAPAFILRDYRHKSIQGLQWIKGNPEVFTQEQGKPRIVKKFVNTSNQVRIAGPGLVYFIAANLEKLISKKIFNFQYIIPGRIEVFDFNIKTIAHNSEVAEFEVRMNSMLRFFSPALKLIYSIQKKRLIFYEGPSNIRDEEWKMMIVDIKYVYEN